MPNYDAWNSGVKALSGGVDYYEQAKAQRAQKERQAALDAQNKAMSDITMAEKTPSIPGQEYGLPGDVKMTRPEAVEFSMRRALEAMKKKSGGGDMQMTPGRKAADIAAGKSYEEFAGGGSAEANKGLEGLTAAKARLGAPTEGPGAKAPVSGGVRGLVPDWLRKMSGGADAVQVKDDIRGAVMSTLKATLGAQFTEKEGERIFNLAYDDTQTPENNMKKLNRTIGSLTKMVEAKQSMADYFEQHGTLTGWQGRQPVSTDIGDEQDVSRETQPQEFNASDSLSRIRARRAANGQ